MGVLDQIKAKKAAQIAAAIAQPIVKAPEPVKPAEVVVPVPVPVVPKPAEEPKPNGGLRSILARNIGQPAAVGKPNGLAAAIAASKAAPQAKTALVPAAAQAQTNAVVTPALTPVTPDKAAAFKEEAEKLKANIAFLKSHMNDLPLIKDVVVTIFKQVKNTPDLNIVMEESDYEITMEGFKRAYQWAARMRTEKRETKAKKNALSDEFARSLKDGGFVVD